MRSLTADYAQLPDYSPNMPLAPAIRQAAVRPAPLRFAVNFPTSCYIHSRQRMPPAQTAAQKPLLIDHSPRAINPGPHCVSGPFLSLRPLIASKSLQMAARNSLVI
ncbi:MAG: hypothetical protein WAL75_27505 [Terracidiphilus sp.]